MPAKKLNGTYVKGREITTDMVGRVAVLEEDTETSVYFVAEEAKMKYPSVESGVLEARLFRIDPSGLGRVIDPCSVRYQWSNFFIYESGYEPVFLAVEIDDA